MIRPVHSIGAGISEPGDCYMNGGTSAGIVFKRKPGDTTTGGQTASSGSSFRWLRDTICQYEQFWPKAKGAAHMISLTKSWLRRPSALMG